MDAQFDSPIPSIVIDRPKMAMALIHLLTNSLDIVGQTENAFTRISVKNHSDAVEVIVENSGPMIPDSECERIFDFMYTTKGAEHMGLGLSLARGIARLHNGDLTYDPQRGFVLRIPHETNLQIS